MPLQQDTDSPIDHRCPIVIVRRMLGRIDVCEYRRRLSLEQNG